ncbi:hypothetical protein KIPB_006740, partial [Kipferlia bialata]|eukprot:g6740.t1
MSTEGIPTPEPGDAPSMDGGVAGAGSVEPGDVSTTLPIAATSTETASDDTHGESASEAESPPHPEPHTSAGEGLGESESESEGDTASHAGPGSSAIPLHTRREASEDMVSVLETESAPATALPTLLDSAGSVGLSLPLPISLPVPAASLPLPLVHEQTESIETGTASSDVADAAPPLSLPAPLVSSPPDTLPVPDYVPAPVSPPISTHETSVAPSSLPLPPASAPSQGSNLSPSLSLPLEVEAGESSTGSEFSVSGVDEQSEKTAPTAPPAVLPLPSLPVHAGDEAQQSVAPPSLSLPLPLPLSTDKEHELEEEGGFQAPASLPLPPSSLPLASLPAEMQTQLGSGGAVPTDTPPAPTSLPIPHTSLPVAAEAEEEAEAEAEGERAEERAEEREEEREEEGESNRLPTSPPLPSLPPSLPTSLPIANVTRKEEGETETEREREQEEPVPSPPPSLPIPTKAVSPKVQRKPAQVNNLSCLSGDTPPLSVSIHVADIIANPGMEPQISLAGKTLYLLGPGGVMRPKASGLFDSIDTTVESKTNAKLTNRISKMGPVNAVVVYKLGPSSLQAFASTFPRVLRAVYAGMQAPLSVPVLLWDASAKMDQKGVLKEIVRTTRNSLRASVQAPPTSLPTPTTHTTAPSSTSSPPSPSSPSSVPPCLHHLAATPTATLLQDVSEYISGEGEHARTPGTTLILTRNARDLPPSCARQVGPRGGPYTLICVNKQGKGETEASLRTLTAQLKRCLSTCDINAVVLYKAYRTMHFKNSTLLGQIADAIFEGASLHDPSVLSTIPIEIYDANIGKGNAMKPAPFRAMVTAAHKRRRAKVASAPVAPTPNPTVGRYTLTDSCNTHECEDDSPVQAEPSLPLPLPLPGTGSPAPPKPPTDGISLFDGVSRCVLPMKADVALTAAMHTHTPQPCTSVLVVTDTVKVTVHDSDLAVRAGPALDLLEPNEDAPSPLYHIAYISGEELTKSNYDRYSRALVDVSVLVAHGCAVQHSTGETTRCMSAWRSALSSAEGSSASLPVDMRVAPCVSREGSLQ